MASIINKMRMDQCSKELIAEMTGEKLTINISQSETSSGSSSGSNTPVVNLSDPKFKKYHMMKKIGQPMASVLNKMRMDGCTVEEQNAMEGKKVGRKKKKVKIDKKSAMKELAINLGLNPKTEREPLKVDRLKRYHWQIIELKDIKKTFWADINQEHGPGFIQLGDKFELDFQVRKQKPRLLGASSPRSPGGGALNLAEIIGGKRRVTKENVLFFHMCSEIFQIFFPYFSHFCFNFYSIFFAFLFI